MKAYKADLAWIHDTGFGDFSRNAAPGLLALLREHNITSGLVVDLGCGSGIWAKALTDAGFDALGIDLSAAMIALARKRAPQAEFRTGSFLKIKLPSCAAVTALGECFNYLFDQGNSIAELRRFFRRVFDALQPGGLFIFDIAEPGRGKGNSLRRHEGKDWLVLAEITEDKTAQLLTRRITTFRKAGKLYQRDDETHHLQLYPRGEMLRVLRDEGFRARTLRGYGEQRFPAAWTGFLAKKPKTEREA